MQLKLDLKWNPGKGPTVSLETVRVELVRLMAATIVVTQGKSRKEGDDELYTPEDW